VLLPSGEVACEGSGTYLPVQGDMERLMVDSWPGFAHFIGREDEGPSTR
jgi:hypothetical protein